MAITAGGKSGDQQLVGVIRAFGIVAIGAVFVGVIDMGRMVEPAVVVIAFGLVDRQHPPVAVARSGGEDRVAIGARPAA